MTLVGWAARTRLRKLPPMMNMVSLSELAGPQFAVPVAIICPICHNQCANEQSKAAHMESAHPNWAALLMMAYLRQTPRENG